MHPMKSGFFAESTEDEVRVLFRDEAQFGELTLKQAGAEQAAGPDSHRALKQVITASEGIL